MIFYSMAIQHDYNGLVGPWPHDHGYVAMGVNAVCQYSLGCLTANSARILLWG